MLTSAFALPLIQSLPPAHHRHHPAHRIQLDNGIRLLIVQNPTVDIVAARFLFQGGGRIEHRDQAGLGNLTAAVLTKGTQQRSSQAIAAIVESLGAGISADNSSDYFELGLKCVSADFAKIMTLIGEILQQPSFPEQEFERERGMMMRAIQAQKERLFPVAFDQLRQILYPNHPYAIPVIGHEATLQSLTREDLVAFHQHQCRPDRLVLAIVGPLPVDEVLDHVLSVLGHWSGSSLIAKSVDLDEAEADPIRVPQTPQQVKTYQDTQQSLIMIGYQGARAGSADYAALKLLATYLGNGLSSRLFVELREKRGLAYEVSAHYATRLDPSPLIAYLGTAADNTEAALDALHAELDRLRADPLDPEVVELTQRKVLGQYALGKQTNAQIAHMLAWYETLGLGLEFDHIYPALIRELTSEQLYEVTQKYLATPITSLVGPEWALKTPEDS